MANWQSIDHGSQDVVLCVAYNVYGTRLATGSADHHIRVFDKDKEGMWKLTACWRAHDGDVTDVKWSTPLLHPPQTLISISTDATLKFWTENLRRQPLDPPKLPKPSPSYPDILVPTNPNQQNIHPINPWVPLAPTIPSQDRHNYPWVSLAIKTHFPPPPSANTGTNNPSSSTPSASDITTNKANGSRRPSSTPTPTPTPSISTLTTPTVLAAAITHTGHLSIFQPPDPHTLAEPWTDWMGGRDFYVCDRLPRRGEESGFCLAWHEERLPCWTALAGGDDNNDNSNNAGESNDDARESDRDGPETRQRRGLDRGSVALAVGCGVQGVKVFRTDGAGKLFLACQFGAVEDEGGAGASGGGGYWGYEWDDGEGLGLIRSVAWGNGSVRGWDTIATGSKDGVVRVWELRTPGESVTGGLKTEGDVGAGSEGGVQDEQRRQQQPSTPSGLTASLRYPYRSYRARLNTNPILSTDEGDLTHIVQTAKLVAELAGHEGAVWKVGFSVTGDLLTSTGDDGMVRFWRRNVEGVWMAWGDLDVGAGMGTDYEDEEEEEEEIEVEAG